MNTISTMGSDTVVLVVRTDIGDEIRYSMQISEWEDLKNESPSMFCCATCNVLSGPNRPYPGARCKCPSCDKRMARVKYIFRDEE